MKGQNLLQPLPYQIAKTCHEVNRAYCLSIGDTSQRYWDDAPEWQKESAVAGVREVLNNPDITAVELHQKWCDFKMGEGWIYGTEKDADAKTHHCLVSYDRLPVEQQLKDGLFHAVVHSFLQDDATKKSMIK